MLWGTPVEILNLWISFLGMFVGILKVLISFLWMPLETSKLLISFVGMPLRILDIEMFDLFFWDASRVVELTHLFFGCF